MAAITSAAAGNHNVGGSWVGGVVPGIGDRVILNHHITVVGNWTVGELLAGSDATLAIYLDLAAGQLTVNPGVTLTSRGKIGWSGNGPSPITVGAGGGIEVEVPAADYYDIRAYGTLIFNGTTGARCFFRSKAGGGRFGLSGLSFLPWHLDWNFVDCDRIGDAANLAINCAAFAQQNIFKILDCNINDCGAVYHDNQNGATVIQVERNIFTNSNHATRSVIIGGGTAKTTGDYRVVGNSFDKKAYLGSCTGFLIRGNYHHEGPELVGPNTGFAGATFQGNLLRKSSFYEYNWYFENTKDVYWLEDHATANPHPLSANAGIDQTIDGVIFEYSGTDGQGDCITQAPTSGHVLNIINCIVLPNADGVERIGTLNSHGAFPGAVVNIRHNTFPAGSEPGIAVGEATGGLDEAGQIGEYRSNICFSVTGGVNRHAIRDVADAITNILAPANATHNCHGPGIAAGRSGKGYDYDVTGGAPGANDLPLGTDPEFVDKTRRLAKWDLSLGGAGTTAAALARLQADPSLIESSLIPYVREGFRPTNALLDGAAHDGGTIGAVAFGGAPSYGPMPYAAEYDALRLWPSATGAAPYPQFPQYLADQDDHYDPLEVFEQNREIDGPAAWDDQIAEALSRARDQSIFPSGGGVAGHHAYGTGLLLHWERAAESSAKDACLLISRFAAGNADDSPEWFGISWESSREVAFSIRNKIAAERLGQAHRARLDVQANQAIGHIDQWTLPVGQDYYGTVVRPFMVALTCQALIEYWDRYRDEPDTGAGSPGEVAGRIPAAIKKAADYLWLNTWSPDGVDLPVDGSPEVSWIHGTFRYGNKETGIGDPNGVVTDPGEIPPIASNVNDAAATAIKFNGPATLSSQNDRYKLCSIQFTSGPLSGQRKQVSSYDGATRTFHFDFPGHAFTAGPANGTAFKIIPNAGDVSYPGYGLGFSGGRGAAPDLNLLISPLYAWVYWYLAATGARDDAYRGMHDDIVSGSVVRSASPGTQKVYNQNWRWSARGRRWRDLGDPNSIPAADAVAIEAPAGPSRAGELTGPFTVRLWNDAGATGNVQVAAPVVVTPFDITGGEFLPASVKLTTDRPTATFRYRAAGVGSKSIGISTEPVLAVGAAPYEVAGVAPIATTYTATGAAPLVVGIPSDLTLALPVGSVPSDAFDPEGGLAVIATWPLVNCEVHYGPAPGGFGQYIPHGWLSAEEPSLLLAVEPAAEGAVSVTFSNDGDLIDPAAFADIAGTGGEEPPPDPVSTYTLTGPAGGEVNAQSSAFVVTLGPGSVAGPIRFTPTASAGSQIFIPAYLDLTNTNRVGSFVMIPTTVGARNVSAPDNGGLADPAVVAYDAVPSSAPPTVVDDSPRVGDAGIRAPGTAAQKLIIPGS